MTQRILIADSDPYVLHLLSLPLQEAGFDVDSVHTGEAAFHVLCAERPDLMIVDLDLPGRNGLDLLRWVRSEPRLSTLPVVLLAARMDEKTKIAALELGADDYLTKPLNPRLVLARVRAILRRTAVTAGQPHIL